MTVEEMLLRWLEEKTALGVKIVLSGESVSVKTDNIITVNDYVREGTFFVECLFSSKKEADSLLSAIDSLVVSELPYDRPLVMKASLIGQDVERVKNPNAWLYVGAFTLTYPVFARF